MHQLDRHRPAYKVRPRSLDRGRLKKAVDAVRQQGRAWVDGELDESMCGLAVPVRDRDGPSIAAIDVSLASVAFRAAAVDAVLTDLRQAASQLRASTGR